MKKQSRTVPRRRQSVSPTPRHLPLVDILIDTQAELQELVVASGLKVLEAMLEEDRAAVCGPRYAHQPARQAYRTGHTPSQVVLGGRKVAIRRPRARRAGEEVPLPTARAFANADPLNRRVVDQMLIGVATRQYARSLEPLGADVTTRGTSKSAVSRCLGAQLAISVNNCPPPRDPRSRMTSVKRTQRKYVQKAYRVRNWREYETGLRARGSLTVWLGLTDGKLANWNSPRPTRRKPGRQRKYSNHAIETTVTLGLVFGLASRQTEGFLRSLLTLLNLDNDVPDHSTISRRKARLGKVASCERRTVKPVHLLIDSSGLSVHVGQLRTPPKARDYRKLHLAVDEQTSDVVACELTSKRARDASRVASLVGQIERPIASAKADAAYDTGDV